MYIIINHRPDRLGSNLTWYFMQVIYAHYKQWFIHYHNDSPFSNSIFMRALVIFIDKYNFELGEKLNNHDHLYTEHMIEDSQQDWPGNNMKVCKEIKTDLITYFQNHIFSEYQEILSKLIVQNSTLYSYLAKIPFNQIIAVHLRLDDVVERKHYNGIYSTEYYRNRLESGNISIDLDDERLFFQKRGIDIPGWNRNYNPYDCQAPIAEHLIEKYIKNAQKKYPTHKVVLVTSPISKTELPYPIIQSADADTDILILSKADVVICSKSLFCFSSLYLSKATEIYLPMWGHIAGTGLTSKYDDRKNITYIY